MSALATLPTSSDPTQWSVEEKALVEAAGLVHTDGQTGAKTPADRPTVAAFLQHCSRTGLDPIARQIYCIARKSKGQLKWQIQISIDGARLVAERTGQYEGQTTPEFTSNGNDWTQVWLSDAPPKAARVGVYRRGFREPLYAVALWDAYVQTTYKGDVTEMWRKMGPLMLAKCAEMLALRKAFPQDLSGLYSAEEMSQADSPSKPEPQRAAATQPALDESSTAVKLWGEWKEAIDAAPDKQALTELWQQAQPLLNNAIPGDAQGRRVGDYFMHVAAGLPDRVDVATGEVDADPVAETPVEAVVEAELEPSVDEEASVTEWPVAQIPTGDVAMVSAGDDDAPF